MSRIGSELPKLKTAFYASHFPHCGIYELYAPVFSRKFHPFNTSQASESIPSSDLHLIDLEQIFDLHFTE